MKIGFAGTAAGMTRAQKDVLRALILQLRPSEFHHRDCKGSDGEADEVVRSVAKSLGVRVLVHPSLEPLERAFCSKAPAESCRPEAGLLRDRAIVDSVHCLIAAPTEDRELLRSTTWMMVRYARKRERHVVIVFPSGKYRVERAKSMETRSRR